MSSFIEITLGEACFYKEALQTHLEELNRRYCAANNEDDLEKYTREREHCMRKIDELAVRITTIFDKEDVVNYIQHKQAASKDE